MKQLKTLSVLFVVLISLSFNGCSWCNTIEFVDRKVEVKVPTKCVVPNVACDIDGTDAEVVVGLTKCIVDHKRAAEVCK